MTLTTMQTTTADNDNSNGNEADDDNAINNDADNDANKDASLADWPGSENFLLYGDHFVLSYHYIM